MTSPANNRRRAGRRAFTLLEILLVLTLIALVAAVSWPSFQAWFEGQRLRQGVDNVRTLWVKGRTRAMEEGRPYRFVWQETQYRLAPDSLADWPDLSNSAFPPAPAGPGYAPGLVVEDVLPEGVRFLTRDGSPMPMEGSPEMILFWSDGTAKVVDRYGKEWPETQVLLADRRGQVRALHLRGLTGVVTVFNPAKAVR